MDCDLWLIDAQSLIDYMLANGQLTSPWGNRLKPTNAHQRFTLFTERGEYQVNQLWALIDQTGADRLYWRVVLGRSVEEMIYSALIQNRCKPVRTTLVSAEQEHGRVAQRMGMSWLNPTVMGAVA